MSDYQKKHQSFLAEYPAYAQTSVLDTLRKTEYKRLDRQNHVYLDYTGANLYAKSQVKKHLRLLKKNVFGNPHSTNPTSQMATSLVEETRQKVLDFFNAGDDYYCVFTPNASGAIKIVGESYPFGPDSFLLLSVDNHNSANGIREFAIHKQAHFQYTPVEKETLYINREALLDNLSKHHEKDRLFVYPAQSNVSGMRHPLDYVKIARDKGWDVLLDAAAFVPSSQLDLQTVKADFVAISFYKIFGYPTGIGCLLVRKDKFDKLTKPWYAGGTISVSAVTFPGHFLMNNHERYEDGTINYLGIPAVGIGLDYIRSIGMDIIHKRVYCLTDWTLHQLTALKHSNGMPLVKVFGAAGAEHRGGTLVMNFYDPQGKLLRFNKIEEEANRQKISIRTGCFCNPGLDETNNEVTYEELCKYFTTRQEGDFHEMIDLSGKLRGSVRISFGLATNFNDVDAFIRFAAGFKDRALDS